MLKKAAKSESKLGAARIVDNKIGQHIAFYRYGVDVDTKPKEAKAPKKLEGKALWDSIFGKKLNNSGIKGIVKLVGTGRNKRLIIKEIR